MATKVRVSACLITVLMFAMVAPVAPAAQAPRIPLIDTVGTYGRSISTDSDLAQKYFDQGLRFTFGYYFPEAVASFTEASCSTGSST